MCNAVLWLAVGRKDLSKQPVAGKLRGEKLVVAQLVKKSPTHNLNVVLKHDAVRTYNGIKLVLVAAGTHQAL